MLKDTVNAYGRISVINHWLLALLMIVMLALGLTFEQLDNGPLKSELRNWHKSLGMLVLLLGMWRVAWRIVQGFPEAAGAYLPWEKMLARAVHVFLLAMILIMPLSGYFMSTSTGRSINMFGLFEIGGLIQSKGVKDFAHSVHGFFPNLLIAIIVLHIGAALKHHFKDKDATLRRMLRF